MYKFIVAFCFLSVGCSEAVCGNALLEAGEACDDANTTNADGCEANCTLPVCNNGIVDPGEVCFFAPLILETERGPNDIVAVDLNNDDVLDLVTAIGGGGFIRVFFGDGVGGFSTLPDLVLDDSALFLVAVDLDGDGFLDLAITFTSDPDVHVFRGLGDGSFAPLATLLAADPHDIVAGDFSENGAIDLVVANGAAIDVHLNNGAGGFLAPDSFSAGDTVSELVSGDFNGDDNLDVVALQGFGNTNAFVVFLGDGLGNFSALAPQLTDIGPKELVAQDVNGDGILDLALISGPAGDISVFTGNGDGLFSTPNAIPVPRSADLAFGDLNNDGLVDLALSNQQLQNQNSNLAIKLGGSAGVFLTEPLLFALGDTFPEELVLADLNADGALDVAVIEQVNQVFVFLSEP
jgi:cysteine-rich repeat protein